MNKRTIKIKYRHIPRPTTDSAEQQKQLGGTRRIVFGFVRESIRRLFVVSDY